MLKNIATLFHKKIKSIEDELNTKTKIDEVLSKFLREEILKNTEIDCQLSYTFNKGIVKIETNNKLVAQEFALRIRYLEEKLRKEGIVFRKLLI
jgi:hypothetical protein